MADLAGLTGSVRSAVGRYFSLVSFVPSALFATYAFVLATSGAWNGPPRWDLAVSALAALGPAGVLWLILAAFGLGLVVHPLQFAIVQLYEGYWGISRPAQGLRIARVQRHMRRFQRLQAESNHLASEIEGGERYPNLHRHQEVERIRASYPRRLDDFLPTRLGNILRRYERAAGEPYGIEAVRAVPLLALVAAEKDVTYLDDQRANLDLAVRMSATALLATLLTVAFLWDDGWWLLIALIPYGMAYLLYRGAIVAAHEYGVAMAALIALNRFALYERMHLRLPASIGSERGREDLAALLDLDGQASGSYAHPAS